MKLLTPKQRTLLAQIARRGWSKLAGRRAVGESFDDWRAREAEAACGARISAAGAEAFDDLFVHFKAMAGEVDEAYRRAVSGIDNQQRIVLHLIRETLRLGGLEEGYALHIARDKWMRRLGLVRLDGLEALPLHALRTVLFDVRRAVRAKR